MKKALFGLAVGSGVLSTTAQLFAWVVRMESEIDLSFSWFGSYVASICVMFAVATLRSQK